MKKPEKIVIPEQAAHTLKALRSVAEHANEKHNVFLAGIRSALSVPDTWVFDAETFTFVELSKPPQQKGEKK